MSKDKHTAGRLFKRLYKPSYAEPRHDINKLTSFFFDCVRFSRRFCSTS